MSNDQKQQPVKVLRDEDIKAAIWRNEGKHGVYFTATFNRSYLDEKENYQTTQSYTSNSLLRLARLTEKAYDLIEQLSQNEKANQSQQNEA